MQTELIAVIDTETNWDNCLMSAGIVIADAENLRPIDAKYIIITPEYERGGMYYDSLGLFEPAEILFRFEAADAIAALLKKHGVRKIFAYNARFDRGVLSELNGYAWYDIMGVAAYAQYNKHINARDCCRSGRLKRGYGVESILRLISGESNYFETHNALIDALDELTIMRMLGHGIEVYETARI